MKRIILFITLILTSCASPSPTPDSGASTMPTLRYLALGDSYTIGEHVDEPERWTSQLASLIEHSLHFGESWRGVEITTIAKTGWTTNELWEYGIQKTELIPPYDLVTLLIGVNNQYRGRDLEEYRTEFVFLLNKAIEYAGGDANRVVVLSIPDWGVTPFAGNRDIRTITVEIQNFNAVNREETENAGAHYVDITPTSYEAIEDPSLIAGDGLHPSGKMYAKWAALAFPIVEGILAKP